MIGQEMIISQKCKKSVFWGGFLIANFFFLNLFYFAKVVWFYIGFPQVAQEFRKKMMHNKGCGCVTLWPYHLHEKVS